MRRKLIVVSNRGPVMFQADGSERRSESRPLRLRQRSHFKFLEGRRRNRGNLLPTFNFANTARAAQLIVRLIVRSLRRIQVQRDLTELITVYAWLRVATSIMTVLSAWKLRKSQPAMERPFVIPGGKLGLFYAATAPVLMGIVAVAGSILSAGHFVRVWGPVGILLGPLAYLIVRRKKKPSY